MISEKTTDFRYNYLGLRFRLCNTCVYLYASISTFIYKCICSGICWR